MTHFLSGIPYHSEGLIIQWIYNCTQNKSPDVNISLEPYLSMKMMNKEFYSQNYE
jgi:hypothetical protein